MSLPIRYRNRSGQARISVTQVLTLAGRIDAQWFTEAAAARGQAVHHLTEVFDRGGHLFIPPGLEGYIEAYATFLAVCKPEYAESEKEVVSEGLELGGRIDRVCRRLFGGPGLLDFKTGPPYDWHGQQLAAYNELAPTGARWGCYLHRDGTYQLKLYDDPADRRKFLYDLARMRGTVTPAGEFWIPTLRTV